MENELSWQHNTLISELIQGMEVARKLKADLRTSSSATTRDLLLQRLLSSYEKALLILRWNASNSKSHPVGAAVGSSAESPICTIGSPVKNDIDEGLKNQHDLDPDSKKRKMMPRWVDQVRVSSETSLEGPHDDGYSWRKYGQKDILGAKYPRSYYRCTYRNTQGCWATKQVQRSDEDPTIFDITYRGKHTCSQGSNAILPPKSPDKKENPRYYNDTHHGQQGLTEYKDILGVNTDNLEDGEIACSFTSPMTSFGYMMQNNHSLLPLSLENDYFLANVSQTLFPPTTPEPIYYSCPSFKINEFDGHHHHNQCSESDITEIISANTSATNSPIPDFNFSLDPVEIDPNFPFDTPGFFS